jgi:hypothetical protein
MGHVGALVAVPSVIIASPKLFLGVSVGNPPNHQPPRPIEEHTWRIAEDFRAILGSRLNWLPFTH